MSSNTQTIPVTTPQSMISPQITSNSQNLTYESWIMDLLENTSTKLDTIKPNSVYFYLKEDVYSALLPAKRNVEITCMRIKQRSPNAPVEAIIIKIGEGIIIQPSGKFEARVFMPTQILVSV